jgi:peptidoglycan/xylan/chitin deacetylase (PgdA/CDA1 family)
LAAALFVVACDGDGDGEPTSTQAATRTPARTVTRTPTPSPPPNATYTPAPPPPTVAPPTPLPTGPAQVIRRGNAGRRQVALTFDAGSDTGFAAQILDTLAANGIKATFGMTGRWAEQNPDLVRRMAREGHVIMNHTYDHRSFTGSSPGTAPLTQAERWDELDRAESIVRDLTGATTKPWFRPPYGDYDDSVNGDVGARGYAYNIMWTVDSLGWNGLSAAAITERCLSNAEPGAIYLLHVGSASQDAVALQSIIDGLRANGYSFATVPALIAP